MSEETVDEDEFKPSNKMVHVEELENYNDIDDLSTELYGHHLNDFDSESYSLLDSISAAITINEVHRQQRPSTLGKAYSLFLEHHSDVADAKENGDVAENILIPTILKLFHFLVEHGFEPTVLRGSDFTKDLKGCSTAIESWVKNTRNAKIKHLVISINNLIIDPCFKRLGQAVRIDSYPLSDFQRLWRHHDVVASPTLITKVQQSALFSKPAQELQVPTPPASITETVVPEVHQGPTKIQLTVGDRYGRRS
jgi:hypothetical protein